MPNEATFVGGSGRASGGETEDQKWHVLGMHFSTAIKGQELIWVKSQKLEWHENVIFATTPTDDTILFNYTYTEFF